MAILCSIVVTIIILPNVYAFLDVKSFDAEKSKYGQIEINDWLFFNKADYRLTDYDASIINVWAEGEYELYKETHLFRDRAGTKRTG